MRWLYRLETILLFSVRLTADRHVTALFLSKTAARRLQTLCLRVIYIRRRTTHTIEDLKRTIYSLCMPRQSDSVHAHGYTCMSLGSLKFLVCGRNLLANYQQLQRAALE